MRHKLLAVLLLGLVLIAVSSCDSDSDSSQYMPSITFPNALDEKGLAKRDYDRRIAESQSQEAAKPTPLSAPRLPLQLDEDKVGSMVSQLIQWGVGKQLLGWWAIPDFSGDTYRRWDIRAFWQGKRSGQSGSGNTWRVKAYHFDGSYLGEWSVPDYTFTGDVQPADERARAVLKGQINMLLPSSVTKQQLVQNAQRYLLGLTQAQARAEGGSHEAVWKMLRSGTRVDWTVRYTRNSWILYPRIDPRFGDPDSYLAVFIDAFATRVTGTLGGY